MPLWLPVGGVAGVAAWFWLPGATAWQGFLLLAAALVVAGLGFGRGGRTGRAIALFALAAALGCGLIWWKAERAAGATLSHPQVVAFTAQIERVEPLPARESIRLTLHPLAVSLDARGGRGVLPPRIRLTVPIEDAVAGLAPDAMISARARLVPPPSAAITPPSRGSRASAPPARRWPR